MQLAVWLVICLSLSFAWSQHAYRLLILALALRIAVPSYAGMAITGPWNGSEVMHPSSLLIITAILPILASNAKATSDEIRAGSGIYGLLAIVSLFFATFTALSSQPNALLALTNVFLVPIAFLFLARVAQRAQPSTFGQLRRAFLVIACFEAGLALVQLFAHTQLIWGSYAVAIYTRPLGTLDSPLDLALILVLAIPLTAGMSTNRRMISTTLLLTLGIIASASRLPTAAACLAIVWLVFFRPTSLRDRAFSLIAASVGVALVLQSGVTATLSDRVANDQGSADTRGVAYDYLFAKIPEHWLSGDGFGSTSGLKGTVLASSLESGYGIYALDLGVACTLILLIAQAAIVLRRNSRGLPGARLGAVLGIVLAFFYSGLSTMSAASFTIWMLLALVGSTDEPEPPSAPKNANRRRRKYA